MLNVCLYAGDLGLRRGLRRLVVVVVVVGFFEQLSVVAVRVQLSGAHQVDILLCDEAERGHLCTGALGGGGGGGCGGISGHKGSLSLGRGGGSSGAGLQTVVLHFRQRADGGKARVVVPSPRAMATGRLHTLQVRAAEL